MRLLAAVLLISCRNPPPPTGGPPGGTTAPVPSAEPVSDREPPMSPATAPTTTPTAPSPPPGATPLPSPGAIDLDALRGVLARYRLPSIAAAVVEDGEVRGVAAVGVADPRAGATATADTLYLMASCSKPFVGLVAALQVAAGKLDVDADVNEYLEWDSPLAHPRARGQAVTLSHLATHTAGVARDHLTDYEDYARPDPPGDLDAFLRGFFGRPGAWLSTPPGRAEAYSNVGTALAALVVERAAGESFAALSRRTLFAPLGMNDTAWFMRDLSPAQRARVARPVDDDGTPLEHYGFDDWPSGQLRTSATDLARLLAALTGDATALPAAARDVMQRVPLFWAKDGAAFEHAGAEAGTGTYLRYTPGGAGLAYLYNATVGDDDKGLHDALIDALDP